MISMNFIITFDNFSSPAAIDLFSSSTKLTHVPNNTEKTIRGSILDFENKPEKSETVMAFTNCSPRLTGSTASGVGIVIFVPAAGGKILTTIMIITEAMAPVTTKVRSIYPKIIPSLFILIILPTALEIVTKTKGTTAVNIRLMKISPKGFKTVAFSFRITPIMLPTAIPDNKRIGKE